MKTTAFVLATVALAWVGGAVAQAPRISAKGLAYEVDGAGLAEIRWSSQRTCSPHGGKTSTWDSPR